MLSLSHFVKVSSSVLRPSSSLMAEKSDEKLNSCTPPAPPMSPPTPLGVREREEPAEKGIREEEASLAAVESTSIERIDGGMS